MRISSVATALMFVAVALLLSEQPAQMQGFSSGSTGADGALDFSQSPPGTIIEFNPDNFNPALDPDRDNVYHFTTINIPTGVTVRLTAKHLNGPVYWLATGNVQINGTIDLNGGSGHPIAQSPAGRIPSIPGAGGFSGGMGGNNSGSSPPQPGNGPLGGGAGHINGGSTLGGGGGFSGNQFLVPLVGGSGGGASGRADNNSWGVGGGAGGGALLIASSASITVNGAIAANGGTGFPCTENGAGGGAGGAIRLMAITLNGTGSLSARGANGGCGAGNGAGGRIRLEAFQHNFTGSFVNTVFSRSSPSQTFAPATPPPFARVVSIAGVPVPSKPNGTFETPDVTFNDGATVNVAIEAQFIPPGTIVKVHVFSENGADQIVNATPLQGTLAQSTATASIVFPTGFSRGFVRAVWR